MTNWWNNNAENRMTDFIAWVGNSDQPSKIYCRGYIVGKQYKSIIDCGCGLASEYFAFKENNYNIEYTGLDSCRYFIEKNKENDITMIEAELESDFPIQDNSYECVYCREVIEHLSYYEKAISEMIRIASKEVIIIWFIDPTDKDKIDYWETEDLYHNTYDKKKLEQFIINNKKVASMRWGLINDFSNRKDVIDELFKDGEIITQNTNLAAEATITENIIVAEIVDNVEIMEKSGISPEPEVADEGEPQSQPETENAQAKTEVVPITALKEKLEDPQCLWVKTPKTILHIILR